MDQSGRVIFVDYFHQPPDPHHPISGFNWECLLLQDGAFMVRQSSGQDAQQPYTLVVFYKGRVYNIPIRFLTGTQQYALGREKRGEEVELMLLPTLHISQCALNHIQ